jgi:hypothetical protein
VEAVTAARWWKDAAVTWSFRIRTIIVRDVESDLVTVVRLSTSAAVEPLQVTTFDLPGSSFYRTTWVNEVPV